MILDQNGNEIENPDLTLGHLVDREETIHHPAIEAQQRKTKRVQIAENLYREEVTPAVFPRPAYDEVRKWQEYVPYTDEELAERKAQAEADAAAKAEADAAAKAEAEAQEAMNATLAALPDAIEDLAAVVASTAEQVETMAGAIEELAAMTEGE